MSLSPFPEIPLHVLCRSGPRILWCPKRFKLFQVTKTHLHILATFPLLWLH